MTNHNYAETYNNMDKDLLHKLNFLQAIDFLFDFQPNDTIINTLYNIWSDNDNFGDYYDFLDKIHTYCQAHNIDFTIEPLNENLLEYLKEY